MPRIIALIAALAAPGPMTEHAVIELTIVAGGVTERAAVDQPRRPTARIPGPSSTPESASRSA